MTSNHEDLTLGATALAAVTLFADLPAEARQAIAGTVHGRRYSPGSQIVSHQDPSTDVFFIVAGSVRITFYSASGKEITFRDMHAGEMFGELSAIDGRGRSAYVVAITESLVASLPRDRFLAMLRQHPDIALAALRHLTRLVRALSDRVVEFSTLGVKNRIHAELLRLALAGAREDARATISPSPKHADIASRVSTHREAVTRELNALARAGLLERSRNALTVLDLPALERMVREVSEGRDG